jgi:hypothetical protein
MATHPIHNQLILHKHFREKLRAQFPDADDETLADTLEGLTDLSDLLAEVIRSALEDEAFCDALKVRMREMRERTQRLAARAEKKRLLVGETMAQADLKRLTLPDLTLSLRSGTPSLVVTDEDVIPSMFWKAQPPKLDRQGLSQALKAGESIPGAMLGNPEPSLSVRSKGPGSGKTRSRPCRASSRRPMSGPGRRTAPSSPISRAGSPSPKPIASSASMAGTGRPSTVSASGRAAPGAGGSVTTPPRSRSRFLPREGPSSGKAAASGAAVGTIPERPMRWRSRRPRPMP